MRTTGILAEILLGMRRGQLSDAHWEALEERLLGVYREKGKLCKYPSGVADPRLQQPPFSDHPVQFIMHRHVLRVCQSYCNAVAETTRLGLPLYVSIAADEVKEKGGEVLTDSVRRELLEKSNLRYVKNVPSTLPLYRGMRYLICSKLCVRLSLVNGCVCILEYILFAEEEDLPAFVHAGSPVLLQYMPTRLLLRAVDAKWTLPASQLPKGLPQDYDRRGLFGLGPETVYFTHSLREGR